MDSTRVIAAAGCCLLLAACSSSGQTIPPTPTSTIGVADSAGAASAYVASVNKLCDALLPKVLAAIHGGHDSTYPIAVYRSEVTVTDKLEAEFDRQVAAIPVPPAAAKAHAALLAYISYANGINTKRAAAATQGQASFDREITAENAEAPNDPVIANRTAQGFNESCNAR